MMRHWLIALLLLGVLGVAQAQDTPAASATCDSCAIATETFTPTPAWTPTVTWTATPTWTATSTWTPTATWTATSTFTPTWTPVVQIILITAPPIVIIATQAPVSLPPATALPVQATAPPQITYAPPPTQLTPFYGWQRYQSIHFIAVVGEWRIRSDSGASAGQYRSSADIGAIARYPFQGDGLRLKYRAHPQGCDFALVVDGMTLGNLTSREEIAAWRLSDAYFLPAGYHVLDIRSLAPQTGQCSVDFDYIEVFLNPPLPEVVQADTLNGLGVVPTDAPQPVAQIVLLSAPPTPAPTLTPMPASVLDLTLQIAYDANANQRLDFGEGVRGVSVRLVKPLSQQLLASALSDERGLVRFQLLSEDEVQVLIPLLARSFSVRPNRGKRLSQHWDILLPAVNQPAVIP